MKSICFAVISSLLVVTPTLLQAQERIVCEPDSQNGGITSIWPELYFSDKKELCFDVRGMTEYAGKNCVSSGGSTSWTGLLLLVVDGESKGRGNTNFRVVKPVIDEDYIDYTIEWTRNGNWAPMKKVHINRVSGAAVSYFVTMHGGESFQCKLKSRSL